MTTKMITVSNSEDLFRDPPLGDNLRFEEDGLVHLMNSSIYGANAEEVFNNLIVILNENGAKLTDCVRTWVFLKEITDYQKMVTDRKSVLDSKGLTSYFASTGIMCRTYAGDLWLHSYCKPGRMAIRLDAYTIVGLTPDRIMHLDDFSMLCRPITYGVTFERGTRITYNDRYEYFISGTASVGPNGKSLFPGNLEKQLNRTLENIEALLNSGGATMSDMRKVLVYVRNRDDFKAVGREIAKRYPKLIFTIYQAEICRPELLIEIEGRAVKSR